MSQTALLRRILAAAALVVMVSGCYLPARFDADVEIQRSGYYTLDFVGYLASIPMYQKLKKGEMTPDQEQERIAVIKTDFTRDRGTKSVEYFRDGHFKVDYSKSGDLVKTGMVTFIRRNENMLSLSYSRETGLITVRGKYIKESDADRLRDMGLWMEGILRVKTDTRVIEHNATKVKKGKQGQQTLIWEINSPYDPAPKAILALR